jgi:transposase InsO family protein
LTPELIAVKLKPCGDHLTAAQIEQLQQLCSEYADVFSVGEEVGLFPVDLVPPLTIDTLPGTVPCKQRPYRLSKHEEDWLRGEIAKLVAVGLIRKNAHAEWVSPVVIVRSGDKLRLCINFQRLNAATVPDSHPMPRVEDVVNAMSGCEFYTHLDVRRGFWHLPIAEEDCAKTTFATPWGEQYEFTRCPFGLVNAPAAYQRAMDTAFAGVEGCRVYMDDTYVYSREWLQHLAGLRSVFQRCRQYNIKLNWDKCCFAAPRIKCLGYKVDKGGVTVDEEKVAAIVQLPPPRNAKGVKSFLGMAGYFRQFIENFAEKSAPLTYLTRKSVEFVWTAECQAAFDNIKQALVSAPCLRLPDWSRPFILHVDWSKVAVGCYLSQEDEGGAEYPVAFASRLLTPTEQRYAPLEGECLALVWATHKYRYYLHGRRFKVYTDHKSLEWLQRTRFDNNKVERWALRLQEFNFEIVYKQGEQNVVADCLSRACAAQLLPEVEAGMFGGVRLAVQSTWPTAAVDQKQVDAVACTVCADPGGWDNMVICNKCQQCYHLRCLVPPMTTVPSGDWFCPACDPFFRHGLGELRRDHTPLRYADGDPYTRPEVMSYVLTGVMPDLTGVDQVAATRLAATLRHIAVAVKPHPGLPGWLMVRRRTASGGGWLCCPPLEHRWDVMRLYHDALGHCGSRQLMRVLHGMFHWRGMKGDVAGFVKVCDSCQRRKLALPELPDLQEPVRHAGPFRHVHIDLAGPFPAPLSNAHGQIRQPRAGEEAPKAYVVLMICYFTKAAEFVVVHEKSAATVAAAFFNGWVCRFGVPEHLTSDNGGEFGGAFVHMLQRLGVHHIAISPKHPAANGAVERLVRSFKDIIVKAVNSHPVHWVRMIPHMHMAYMSRVHTAIGASPFEMLHGVQPRLATSVQVPGAIPPAGRVPAEEEQYLQYMQQRFLQLDHKAVSSIQQQFKANQKAWQRRRVDFQRKGDHNLAVGHLALLMDDRPDSSLSQSVQGPYRVVGFCNEGAVAVLESGETALKRGRQQFRRHVSLLARYYDEASVFGTGGR